MSQIKVGNEYARPLGINKQYVVIVGINNDNTIDVETKSKSRRFKTKISNVLKWTLLKEAEIKKIKKRLNEKTFLEVLIETLKNNQHPMTTRQLVDKIVENKSFIFKDTAKTPYNSANSRLNTYIKNSGDDSVVKIVSRGCFAYKF